MVTIFWDTECVLLLDFLDHGRTINGEYYAYLLYKLRDAIKEKRRGKLTRGVLLLQDIAPAHTSKIGKAAAKDCGFELLPHPSYSTDLAPSDFYLFPNMKKQLRGKVHGSDDAIKDAVMDVLGSFDKTFFHNGLELLKNRWTKCIEVQGDYVEK